MTDFFAEAAAASASGMGQATEPSTEVMSALCTSDVCRPLVLAVLEDPSQEVAQHNLEAEDVLFCGCLSSDAMAAFEGLAAADEADDPAAATLSGAAVQDMCAADAERCVPVVEFLAQRAGSQASCSSSSGSALSPPPTAPSPLLPSPIPPSSSPSSSPSSPQTLSPLLKPPAAPPLTRPPVTNSKPKPPVAKPTYSKPLVLAPQKEQHPPDDHSRNLTEVIVWVLLLVLGAPAIALAVRRARKGGGSGDGGGGGGDAAVELEAQEAGAVRDPADPAAAQAAAFAELNPAAQQAYLEQRAREERAERKAQAEALAAEAEAAEERMRAASAKLAEAQAIAAEKRVMDMAD